MSNTINIKKVFLSSTQLTDQHGLCSYSGVFSLSHGVTKPNFDFLVEIELVLSQCLFLGWKQKKKTVGRISLASAVTVTRTDFGLCAGALSF